MNDEPNLERRMILAFALSALVLLVTLPFLPKKKPAAQPSTPAAQSTPVQSGQAEATTPAPAAQTSAPAQESVQATAEQTITVDTDVFHIVFSNRGAVVKSWVLKKYTDESRKPLDLVDPDFSKDHGFPLELRSSDSSLNQQVNQALFQPSQTQLEGPGTLTFRWSNGGTSVVKTLTFDQSYIVHVQTSVTRNGAPVETAVMWPGVFGDRTVKTHYSSEQLFRDTDNSLSTFSQKKIDDGGTWTGHFRFAGVEDQYFTAVFLPPTSAEAKVVTLKTSFQSTEKDQRGKPLETKPVETLGIGISTGPTNSFRMFVGPKQIDLLKTIDPQLRNLVDFGWFSFLADPLFLWMKWTYTHWIHNYGWVILWVTFVITMAIFPLRIRGMKSQLKMAAVQPKVNAINAKIKKLPLKDPRRQELQQEIMKVYSEHGVNPLGGCLPMLLPLPLIFAFYKVLEYAIELRHAPWIGYLRDLSAADPYFILPIVLIVTQFWTMGMMPPTPGQDPRQAKMMRWIMPAFLGYIFFFLPSGVNLYYLASNMIGVGQQYYINRKYAPQQAAVAGSGKAKAGGRKGH